MGYKEEGCSQLSNLNCNRPRRRTSPVDQDRRALARRTSQSIICSPANRRQRQAHDLIKRLADSRSPDAQRSRLCEAQMSRFVPSGLFLADDYIGKRAVFGLNGIPYMISNSQWCLRNLVVEMPGKMTYHHDRRHTLHPQA